MATAEVASRKKIRIGSSMKLLSFLFGILFLFTGCSSSANVSTAEPLLAYQSRAISLPDKITSVLSFEKTINGKLMMVGANAGADKPNAMLWELADDESWVNRADLYSQLPLNPDDICVSAVITKEERLLATFADMSEQNGQYRFFLIDFGPELDYRELEIELPETFSVQNEDAPTRVLITIAPINDNLFLVQDMLNKPFILDCMDETIVSVSIEDSDNSVQVASVAKLGEKVFALCEGIDEGKPSIAVRLLDLSTNTLGYLDDSLAETFKTLFENQEEIGHSGAIPTIESDPSQTDRLTICTSDGIFEYKNDRMRKIAEAEKTVLSNPSHLVLGCVFDNQNDFYLISFAQADSNNPITIHKYEQKEIRPTDNTTLRVYSLEDDAEIRQAIAFFNEEHPDVDVTYEIGLNGNGITHEDALQNLNIELIAGTGPDILFLDGLPIETFAKQGVLYDLTDIYEEAVASDGYYDNVMSSFMLDGECRALPMRFSLPLVAIDHRSADNLDSLSAFIEIATTKVATTPGTGLFCNMSILDDLFASCYPEIINDGSINKDALSEFFQSIGELSSLLKTNDQKCVKPMLENRSSQGSQNDDSFDENAFGRFEFIEDPSQILILQPDYEEELGSLEAIKTIDGTDTNVDLFAPTKRKCFLPRACVAINNNSNEIQLSKDFIRTMLSENYQNSSQREGLSIQKTVLSDRITGASFSISLEDGRRYITGPLSGEIIASYEALFASLDTPIVIDQVIQTAIFQELQRYLDGEVNLDSAVDSCNEKLNLYLAE